MQRGDTPMNELQRSKGMKAGIGAAQVTGQYQEVTGDLHIPDSVKWWTSSSHRPDYPAHGHWPSGPMALPGLRVNPQRSSTTMHLNSYCVSGNFKWLHTPHQRDLTP